MGIDIKSWVDMAAFASGGITMGVGAIGAALGEGYTASKANLAISRNPSLASDIMKTMLVGQAVTESSAIFALVVSIVLLFTSLSPHIVNVCVAISAAICMGLGALGAGISSGLPTASACTGIMRQPEIKERLNTNMLIGAAVCQTPAIFTLVVSFLLIFTNFTDRPLNPTWAAVLGAGISTGLGSMGCVLGGGLVAVSSCEGVARQPVMAAELTNIMLLGQAVTQTTAIYSLLVSFIMMFKVFAPSDAIAPAAALLSAGICMGIGAIAPGLGEGYIAQKAIEWMAKNKKSHSRYHASDACRTSCY